jgi:hypothetical protein
MWFAVAIIGMIAIATGITLLPGNPPQSPPPASSAAPPAQGGSQK